MPRLRVNCSRSGCGRDSVARNLHFPTLTRELKADVAIIGNGITDAALAWRFAGRRRSRRPRRSPRRSAALQRSREHCPAHAGARHGSGGAVPKVRHGPGASGINWQLSLEATRDFVDTLTQLGIECDLVRRDSVYYATEQRDVSRLRDEHRRRTAAGIDARWLEGVRLRRALGFDAPAGIRTSGNAQADPFKACSPGCSARGRTRGRARVRALTGGGDHPVVARRARQNTARLHPRRSRRHCHRLCHAVLQAASRALQDAQHLRRS